MKLISSILMIFVCFLYCKSQEYSTKIEKKAAEIHQKVLTLDTHTDTPLTLISSDYDLGVRHDPYVTHTRLDFPRMEEGQLDAVFFAAFIAQGDRDSTGNLKAKNRTLEILNKIHSEVGAYPNLASIATKASDAAKIEKLNKRAIYIGIENGYAIGHDISLIKRYYDLGVRYMTLCHTQNNDICDSSTDKKGPEFKGLSDFGKEVIEEMNRMGIMVDVSHISDDSFFQAVHISKAPVIASHSCARALCDHPRNMTDAMLKVLAKNDGVIQVCLLSEYVKNVKQQPEREKKLKEIREKYGDYTERTEEEIIEVRELRKELDKKYPKNYATVSDFVDHIDHIVKVIGIDHVGIGSDFDGGGRLVGCWDVSEMGNITLELVRRGYDEQQIQKIWSGNLLRVFNEVQNIAGVQ